MSSDNRVTFARKVTGKIDIGKVIGWVPNLYKLNLTQYCVVTTQTFTRRQEYHNLQEFVFISFHDAFLDDQEAFKHEV